MSKEDYKIYAFVGFMAAGAGFILVSIVPNVSSVKVFENEGRLNVGLS